jgi:hypothetical protein
MLACGDEEIMALEDAACGPDGPFGKVHAHPMARVLTRRLQCLVLGLLPAALAPGVTGAEAPPPPNTSMAQALAELKIPPVWLDAVPLEVDASTPWNKAWDRIEELLMTADPADRRKAMKLAVTSEAIKTAVFQALKKSAGL